MKGLYLVRQDAEMIDRAISAGIDTLLIPFYDIPSRPVSGMDTFDENVAICRQFVSKAEIIAVPVLFPQRDLSQNWIHDAFAIMVNQDFQ